MPRIEANGVMLYYELEGSGERLLCISGTGSDLRQQPRMADGPLTDTFEALSYDQRGLGQSSVPAWPYAMADFADDAGALLDVLGWDDCLVIGISFGGMVAQELAIRHPERVRRLVLACTSAGGAGGASYPLHKLVELSPEERSGVRMQLIDTRWDEVWQKGNPEMVQLLGERMRLDDKGGTSPGLTNQLAARAEHDTTGRLASITCPTLVCGGRFDGIAPPANSEFLARAITGARLEMFDGGHGFFIQDADAFSTIIAFLSENALPREEP
ncbi:MAG TPA: alpha/beta hydrolase [Acidimicrobiales bacterium]|jgi:3-oxoadipate enol-lactonase|nr:alpha/beta hydrolase [Acidimicrobiales bacterium]